MHLILLRLQPLLRCHHLSDPRLHLLQILHLLVVGIVECLVRLLSTVEQVRDLGLGHRLDAAAHSRHHQVRDEKIDRAAFLGENLQRFLATAGDKHRVAVIRQDRFSHREQ